MNTKTFILQEMRSLVFESIPSFTKILNALVVFTNTKVEKIIVLNNVMSGFDLETFAVVNNSSML